MKFSTKQIVVSVFVILVVAVGVVWSMKSSDEQVNNISDVQLKRNIM